MATLSLVIPQIGQPDTTEDVKVVNAFTAIQTAINGLLDSTNLSAGTAQSATVNQSGQTVKGATNIATSESRTNVAYGTLTTPDQVTGIVLPTNGMISVWYQATWQQSVASAARAAIFVGANQLKVSDGVTGTFVEAAAISGSLNQRSLATTSMGLVGGAAGLGGDSYPGDVTTGQAIGISSNGSFEINNSGSIVASASGVLVGGACNIFATAGTYTIAVMFKASSGAVAASNRRLWVQAQSFA